MSVSRRHLLGLAALAPLALTAGDAAAIDFDFGRDEDGPDQDSEQLGRIDYMPFRLKGNVDFTARRVLLLTDAAAYGGSLEGRVTVRDEDKIGIVEDVPLVGGLFSDRLRAKDFDPARRIGTAYRVDDALVLDLHLTRITLQGLAQRFAEAGSDPASPSATLPGSGQVVRSLVAANQKVSYHANAALLSPVVAPGNPTLAALAGSEAAAQPVGEVYDLDGEHLLVHVRPSILTGWD